MYEKLRKLSTPSLCVAAALFALAAPDAWGAGPYGLPVCQAIADDTRADPDVREAQLAHCDIVEEALVEWVHDALARGVPEREAQLFALLYIAPAHWEMLIDIDFAASCGNGTCDEGETAAICPQDCSYGGSTGGGSPPSGTGGPTGPGGGP